MIKFYKLNKKKQFYFLLFSFYIFPSSLSSFFAPYAVFLLQCSAYITLKLAGKMGKEEKGREQQENCICFLVLNK